MGPQDLALPLPGSRLACARIPGFTLISMSADFKAAGQPGGDLGFRLFDEPGRAVDPDAAGGTVGDSKPESAARDGIQRDGAVDSREVGSGVRLVFACIWAEAVILTDPFRRPVVMRRQFGTAAIITLLSTPCSSSHAAGSSPVGAILNTAGRRREK